MKQVELETAPTANTQLESTSTATPVRKKNRRRRLAAW
jgi:hypothetical protein